MSCIDDKVAAGPEVSISAETSYVPDRRDLHSLRPCAQEAEII